MARVGIREVAAHAGVAVGTVSHYLNHPDKVSAEKADRIRVVHRDPRVRPEQRRPSAAAGHQHRDRLHRARREQPLLRRDRRERRAPGIRLRGQRVPRQLAPQQRARGRLPPRVRAASGARPDRLVAPADRGSPRRRRGRGARRPCSSGRPPGRTSRPRCHSTTSTAGGRRWSICSSVGCRRIAFVGGPLGIPQVADRLAGASDAVRDGARCHARGHQRSPTARSAAAARSRPRCSRVRPICGPDGDLRGQRPAGARHPADPRRGRRARSGGARPRRLRRHRVRGGVHHPAQHGPGAPRRLRGRRSRPAVRRHGGQARSRRGTACSSPSSSRAPARWGSSPDDREHPRRRRAGGSVGGHRLERAQPPREGVAGCRPPRARGDRGARLRAQRRRAPAARRAQLDGRARRARRAQPVLHRPRPRARRARPRGTGCR